MSHFKVIHRASKLFQPITAVQKNVQIKNQEVILSRSQRLMLDVGIIKQASPGSFHMLPLGVRAYQKLTAIVDEEMQAIDAQKIMLPTLTNAKLWKATGRLDNVQSELFKMKDRHDAAYILSPVGKLIRGQVETHEEAAADLLASVAPISYKNFPLRLYQIGSKFRDEMKPRFGLMRGRQFYMKDLYCFDTDVKSATETYEAVCGAYDRIFTRIGVDFVKVLGTSGNMGGSISHEYHFPADIGEDKILHCTPCGYTANTELVGSDECPKCKQNSDVRITNGIEVGHAFLLGDKYSKPLKATYLAQNAKPVDLQMGSYGLGLSRILAAAIEVLSLENEIRWPKILAPFSAVIIPPKDGSKEAEATKTLPEKLYQTLNTLPKLSGDILLDDRVHLTIGRRVLDAKRTGHPFVIVVGTSATTDPPLYEVIDVNGNQQQFLSSEQLVDFFLQHTQHK